MEKKSMTEIIEEIWVDIPNYEGLYQVSNLGRVKSLERYKNGKNSSKVFVKEKILRNCINSRGYLNVTLSKDKVKTNYLVHRLVAIAFIKNPKPKYLKQIDHINTIKTDNKVENLRWCSACQNCNNPLTLEKIRKRNVA